MTSMSMARGIPTYTFLRRFLESPETGIDFVEDFEFYIPINQCMLYQSVVSTSTEVPINRPLF